MDAVRMTAVFRGRVQGVGFRFHAQKFAEQHGVTGWIRNTEEGTVEAVFEGEDGAVRSILEYCTKSIRAARVASVSAARAEFTGEFSSFSIR